MSSRSCHATPGGDRARRAKAKLPPPVPIGGSFAPPPDTLQLGVGRQPDGFTCGTETFIGVCEFLRLPLRDPDDDEVEDYKKKLKTSYKTGTDPADLARVARYYLRIGGRVRSKMSVAALDQMTRGAQDYVDALLRGKKPSKPLRVAMIPYQAYVLPDHDKSLYFPRGKEGPRKVLPIRHADGSMIWKDDWSDGHWSAVVRVVAPREKKILRSIRDQIGDRPRADEVLDGVVILADPSNGEGLSFIPIPEFEARWHDTDRDDRPRFRQSAVVFEVSKAYLAKMQGAGRATGRADVLDRRSQLGDLRAVVRRRVVKKMESIVRLEPDGMWHRRFGDRTRCGLPIAGPTSSRDRRPEDNHLCPRCFTRLEIDTGKMKKIEREIAEYNDPDLFWNEEEDTDRDPDPPIDPDDGET